MIKRNSNCDKCNIKLKGNGAYSLQYLGKTYWLCGHCMNGIIKREIKTSEPEDNFVVPVCEEDVVEITGQSLLEHKDICRKEGALEELIEFDDVLEELHMDIYGHDWTKKQILEHIVKIKNQNEKRIEELK